MRPGLRGAGFLAPFGHIIFTSLRLRERRHGCLQSPGPQPPRLSKDAAGRAPDGGTAHTCARTMAVFLGAPALAGLPLAPPRVHSPAQAAQPSCGAPVVLAGSAPPGQQWPSSSQDVCEARRWPYPPPHSCAADGATAPMTCVASPGIHVRTFRPSLRSALLWCHVAPSFRYEALSWKAGAGSDSASGGRGRVSFPRLGSRYARPQTYGRPRRSRTGCPLGRGWAFQTSGVQQAWPLGRVMAAPSRRTPRAVIAYCTGRIIVASGARRRFRPPALWPCECWCVCV